MKKTAHTETKNKRKNNKIKQRILKPPTSLVGYYTHLVKTICFKVKSGNGVKRSRKRCKVFESMNEIYEMYIDERKKHETASTQFSN